jgi:hypothetical protein
MAFTPNALTFQQGIQRINGALQSSGLKVGKGVVTSRDPTVRKAMDALQVSNIPSGFKKWQLPVYFNNPTQLFISVGAPDTDVAEHSHDEGDGIRFIMGGSIIHDGVELTEGDWMFIPKGTRYSMKVGRIGVIACYCYECCCA